MAEIKGRDSRFEVLRLISIFIIVLHHLVLHTAIEHYTGISLNRSVTQLYLIGGKLGVDCFLLITGYFSVSGQFKSSRAVKIEMQTLFYSLLFLFVTVFFAPNAVTMKGILTSLLPTTFRAYWYVTAFMGMTLLSPVICVVLQKLSLKQYLFLASVCIFMFSIAPTLLRQRNWVSELTWFITLFIVGGGIRRFEDNLKKIRFKYWLIGAIGAVLVTWGISLFLMFLSEYWNNKLEPYVNVFSTSNYSTFIFASAVCIFMCFVCMDPFENRYVNMAATHTLGVYLIQSNQYVATVFLWPWIEKFEWYNLKLWPAIAIAVSCAVWFVCMSIETVRSKMMCRISLFDGFCKKIDEIWR